MQDDLFCLRVRTPDMVHHRASPAFYSVYHLDSVVEEEFEHYPVISVQFLHYRNILRFYISINTYCFFVLFSRSSFFSCGYLYHSSHHFGN